jgi:hypothetical protein
LCSHRVLQQQYALVDDLSHISSCDMLTCEAEHVVPQFARGHDRVQGRGHVEPGSLGSDELVHQGHVEDEAQGVPVQVDEGLHPEVVVVVVVVVVELPLLLLLQYNNYLYYCLRALFLTWW